MYKVKIESGNHGCKTKIMVDGVDISGMTRAATAHWDIDSVPRLELECYATDAEIETDAIILLRRVENDTKVFDAKSATSKTYIGIWLPSSYRWCMDALGNILHWELEKLPVAMASLFEFPDACIMIFGAQGQPLALPEKK